MQNTSPYLIKQARSLAGLSARQAAELIYCTTNAWQKWEAGARQMHPAFWELFLIKIGRSPRCLKNEPCDCVFNCDDDLKKKPINPLPRR